MAPTPTELPIVYVCCCTQGGPHKPPFPVQGWVVSAARLTFAHRSLYRSNSHMSFNTGLYVAFYVHTKSLLTPRIYPHLGADLSVAVVLLKSNTSNYHALWDLSAPRALGNEHRRAKSALHGCQPFCLAW